MEETVHGYDVAATGRGRLPSRGRWTALPRSAHGVVRAVWYCTRATVMEQDSRGDIVSGVELEFLHSIHQLEDLASSAEWFLRWTKEVADSHTINIVGDAGWQCYDCGR